MCRGGAVDSQAVQREGGQPKVAAAVFVPFRQRQKLACVFVSVVCVFSFGKTTPTVLVRSPILSHQASRLEKIASFVYISTLLADLVFAHTCFLSLGKAGLLFLYREQRGVWCMPF